MNGFRFSGALLRAGIVLMVAAAFSVASSADAHAQGKTKRTATKVIKTTSTTNAAIVYSYFPSASTTDGRMVSLVGAGLQSMTGEAVEFGIGLPASSDSLRIGIFDGETGGLWDLGTSQLVYTLYADSTADGAGTTLIGTYYGSAMTNNGWYDIVTPTHAAAKSSDTIYFYRLVVTLSDPSTKTWSNFKLRTNGTAMFLPRAFSFAVPLFTTAEARILYPNYPATTTTTYDGTWTFNLAVSEPVEDFEIWDGDMDYGSADGVHSDTDDADTPNDSVPIWGRNGVAVREGVATTNDFIIVNGVRSTTTRMTGAPADDNFNAWYRRSPAVEYSVVDPNGTSYRNANPSGNLEWERFRISTIATTASDYDYLATILPTGTYRIDVSGMDLGNLNAWRMWYSVLGSTDSAQTVSNDGRDTRGPRTSSFRSHPVMVAVDSTGSALRALLPSIAIIGGVGNLNYWKNGTTDWPVSVITVAGTTYTKDEAQDLMSASTLDLTKIMIREVMVAKLNIMENNDGSCIIDAIKDAEEWILDNPIGASNRDLIPGALIAYRLVLYNRGALPCVTYRRGTLD